MEQRHPSTGRFGLMFDRSQPLHEQVQAAINLLSMLIERSENMAGYQPILQGVTQLLQEMEADSVEQEMRIRELEANLLRTQLTASDLMTQAARLVRETSRGDENQAEFAKSLEEEARALSVSAHVLQEAIEYKRLRRPD